MTQELRAKLPKLYAQEYAPDPLVYVKYFLPFSHWYWYAYEFDGKDTFFGWVYRDYPELGYFSLSELESIKGQFGSGVERDMYFTPTPLSEIKKLHNV